MFNVQGTVLRYCRTLSSSSMTNPNKLPAQYHGLIVSLNLSDNRTG